MTEPLQQDTTSVDISAGTAVAKSGGHVVRVSLPRTGDEEQDDEAEVRRRLLEDKARLTHPSDPIPCPDDVPTLPGGPIDMAKYTADQLRSMLARGQAIRNQSGEPSYPIGDEEDLSNAIRAVGRGGADHDAVRRHIIKRARAMGKSAAIPKAWKADGSLQSEAGSPSQSGAAGVRYEGDYRVEPDGRRIYDPDHDGDDDSSPEGDTDHDYVLPSGQLTAKGQRAKAKGGMASETSAISTLLLLEGTVPQPVILQEATADNGGVMRIKTPFYVGESIARAPGFQRPIYFPRALLPGIVQEGRRQIGEGKQPLTVYARHAHATDGDHLPVGAVVDLEQEGRIGYAVLEISPTSTGRDIQVLAQNRHLNAVSLRSGLGRFELEDKKVNGEPMLTPLRLAIDGVDFAPDSPAQPTYGLQILQEDARVEATATHPTPKRRTSPPMNPDELTLDVLRAEYPELLAEIEAPLRRENQQLASRLTVLEQERNARLRDEKLREIAGNFPDPEKALPVLQELCAGCETDAQVAEKAFPVLLEALKQAKATEAPPIEKPARQVLLEMFRPGGAGQVPIVQEGEGAKDHDPAEFAGVDLAEV